MRKITQQAVNAFIAGRKFSSGNTTVEFTDHGHIVMTLHNNIIAIRYCDGDKATEVTNAGWTSNTTKERLNGILDTLSVSGIYQRDWVWYWKDGVEFPHNEFVKV